MFILSRGLKDTCKTPQKSDEKLKHYWVKGFVRTSAIEPPSDNDDDISDEEPATTMVVPKRSVGCKKQPNKVAVVITPKLPPKTKALAKTKAAVVVNTTSGLAAKQPRDDTNREDEFSAREERLRQKEDAFEQRIREMEVRMQAAHQESTVPVKVASISYSAVSTHAAPNVASETKQQDMLEMLKSYSQPAASSNVNKNLLLMNIVAGNEFERQKNALERQMNENANYRAVSLLSVLANGY